MVARRSLDSKKEGAPKHDQLLSTTKIRSESPQFTRDFDQCAADLSVVCSAGTILNSLHATLMVAISIAVILSSSEADTCWA
jgi:hypothetical protein